jgi:hypothetical protein
MEGTIRFASGQVLTWLVCLAVTGPNSPFAYRTVTHTFQFAQGALVYGPAPESDRLIVDGEVMQFATEPKSESWPSEPDPKKSEREWRDYNLHTLYGNMWKNLLASIRGEEEPLHTIYQGINVAAACVLAFESAHDGGTWREVPI